ncbi:MAG: proline dehydrogenase family protein [Acidobacteria bacterium]|nr:proline dehydrogenase family protein [Acidobacteriota bacterium]
MMRTLLLQLSRQHWLREWMQNSSAAGRFTSRFVAGRDLSQALDACTRLRNEGILATLDRLGENVYSAPEAGVSLEAYLKGLSGIADRGLGGTVSVKLTQLGLDLSEALCRDNVRQMAERAFQFGTQVEIDMEASEYVDRTLAIVRHQHAATRNVRAVIQAYLYRSESDVDQLCREGIPVRLCKGAYKEEATVAFPTKREVDASYVSLMRKLLMDGTYPAIASHHEAILREAIAFSRQRGLSPDSFEFQMLYGIRRDLQRELVREGFRLRLYVPYGDAWYPYFMRRLAERPANVWFVVRNLLRA